MNNDNITLLSDKKIDESEAMRAKFKRELPDFICSMALVAEIKMIAYMAYLKEGFEPEQALELCKSAGE